MIFGVCGRRRLSYPVGISRGRTIPSWDSPFGSLLLALWLGARLPLLYHRKQISSCSYGTWRQRLTVEIDNCKISTTLYQRLTHNQTQTSSPAGNNCHLSFQRERWQCTFHVKASSSLDDLDSRIWGLLAHLGIRS